MSDRGEGKEESGSGGGLSSTSHPRSQHTIDSSFLPHLKNLWFLLPILAALWLYRRALAFAYFNDDPTGHFAWMEGRTIAQFFAGSAEYGYYRPVVFTILRLSEWLFGTTAFPHNPVADHTLLWLLHGINAALVWALARRLGGGRAFATVAALLFAFVPFSYEAVAYVASLTHPLLVFWALLALLLYDRNRIAGLIVLSLGLLTHENGLFIFPALVGLDWVRKPGTSWRDRAGRLWPFAVPPVLFIVLWLFIPKNSTQGLNSLADIGRNLIPFLQTLVFPLLPVIRLDTNAIGALLILAAAVVGVVGLLAWRASAWRVWAFALGWFVLSSLPALLFLSPAYVYGSPRLNYLPSIGVALLWAIPVWWLWVAGGRPVISSLMTAIYLIVLLLPPLPFIRCQLDFYDETSRMARDMAEAAAGAPTGRAVIFTNAPFFFSSTTAHPDGCHSAYPWTAVGGILIPPYAQARDFVRFNGGPDRPTEGITYPGYAPGWRTFGTEVDDQTFRAHAAEDAVFVFDLLRSSFDDLSTAWQPNAGPVASPLATFGEALALTGSDITEDGNRLVARLDWRVLTTMDPPLAAFIHVYDSSGALVAQSDGPPGGGLVPQTLWQPGDGLIDERVIDLTVLPPGTYTVAAGVYRTADGVRLPATAGGQPLADDIYFIETVER